MSTGTATRTALRVPQEETCDAELRLMGGFELVCGGRCVSPSISAQRLLAFLAIEERPVSRTYVAGTLWLDASEERAAGSLRSALWRLRQVGADLVESGKGRLQLAAGIQVDLHRMVRHSRELLEGDGEGRVEEVVELDEFCHDLLPDWYEDWVELERERLRQLRLYALEALAERFLLSGRYSEAVAAGLAAVKCEVLRESAHRVLMKAHIAEGNIGEALRRYHRYTQVLATQLGVEPSGQMRDIVAPFVRR